MKTNIDTIREARNKLCELELNLCNYNDDDVRQLQNNMLEGVAMLDAALAALSTIDLDELERVKKERDDYKLWWEGATETHNQLRKLHDEQNARMWSILKRPECPEGLAQRMLQMPEADRDYFLSLAVDTIDPEGLTVESVNTGLDVGLNGEQASADARYAYRSNPFAHRIADTIRYSVKDHDDAIRRECAEKVEKLRRVGTMSNSTDSWFTYGNEDGDYIRRDEVLAILGKEAEK